MNGVRFTPAEKAMLARFDEVKELAFTLAYLSVAEFRSLVDGLPPDTNVLVAVREAATALIAGLGRSDELASATNSLQPALARSGGHDSWIRHVGAAGDRRLNDEDFYRRMRVRERAHDHVLAIIAADHLSARDSDLLRLPDSALRAAAA